MVKECDCECHPISSSHRGDLNEACEWDCVRGAHLAVENPDDDIQRRVVRTVT
jgi:hypothetical protein